MAPARRGLRALVAVGAALAAAERDLQRFAADHLEPLKSAAQLPTLAVEDLMEVFTLRTEVVIPSMLEPVTVSMEHYALAFRLNSVDWDRARTGADGARARGAAPRRPRNARRGDRRSGGAAQQRNGKAQSAERRQRGEPRTPAVVSGG